MLLLNCLFKFVSFFQDIYFYLRVKLFVLGANALGFIFLHISTC